MDTQYKTTELEGVAPLPPSATGLLPNTVMEHEPTRAVAEAQDGVAAGCRRVLASWCLSGAQGFHVPASGLPTVEVAATGSYPDRDTWRSAGAVHVFEVFPGCVVRARIFYVGSGQTQYEDPGGTWNPGGPLGAIRLRHTWTAADTTTAGPLDEDVELPPSPIEDAAAPSGDAAYWQALAYVDVELRPDDLEDDAVAVVWSEGAQVSVELQLRGAPRIVSIVLHEHPVRVAYLHSDAGPHAVNGQSAAETPQTLAPQVEAADGATYEEHRFGTERLASTAQRHDSLGLVGLSLLAWDEATADYTTDVTPISVSSATFVDVLEQTATTYSADRPGFIIAAAHAQQHHLCDAGLVLGTDPDAPPDTAVVPMVVRVEAYLTGAANLATIRIQSGPYEWIDIDVDGVVPAVYEAAGYLESQATPDQPRGVVQVFARVDADTVEILSVTAVFGD